MLGCSDYCNSFTFFMNGLVQVIQIPWYCLSLMAGYMEYLRQKNNEEQTLHRQYQMVFYMHNSSCV